MNEPTPPHSDDADAASHPYRPPVGDQTFLFADLAGFTALTEAHGDERAADLAASFFRDARSLLAAHRAREVKTLGDAIMIRCYSATEAIGIALRLVRELGARHGFPSIRAGMHTGPAVERDGDWFGAAINLAARVSGAAGGGEVLVSEQTAAAAGAPGGGSVGALHGHSNVILRPRGRRQLRNVAEPVELYEASCEFWRPVHALPLDPVCRMAIDPDHEAGRLLYDAVEYHFCSLDCAHRFAEGPDRYASRPEQVEA
jgi:class 3 adenylate cyclase/YHS domain-containing protein